MLCLFERGAEIISIRDAATCRLLNSDLFTEAVSN